MGNVMMVLDVATGYLIGKILWELALAGAHQVGRLSVLLIMRLARQGRSTENSGGNSGSREESLPLRTGVKQGRGVE
jgi:hypothetical protein